MNIRIKNMNRNIALLISIIIFIYAIVCFVHVDARLPGTKKSYISLPKIYGGDEEHYLITVSSLIEDFDLELRNNYYNAQYGGSYSAGEWWRGKYIDHHSKLYNPVTKQYFYAGWLNEEELNKFYNNGYIERPHHPPSMPIAASIFLLPFAHSKYLESAAVLLTVILSIIGFFFLYKVLLYFYGHQFKTKCMHTVLFFALGTPLLFYACSFFKENYVAVFLIFAIYFLFIKNSLFWSGFFISVCFFSKYQMIFICAPLILYPLLERKFKSFLAISGTVFAGGVLLLLYNYHMYGNALVFSQPEYDVMLLKKAASLTITLAVLIPVALGFSYIFNKYGLVKKIIKLRILIKALGIASLLYLLYKSAILKTIVLDPKDGLFWFSPFLIFSVLELLDLRFWQDKRKIIITIVFLFYLVVMFHRNIAIGSAFSLRTGVSIIPLLTFPFVNWYIREKKWILTKLIFVVLISSSIFINTLAAMARIHFWHFPIKEATKGAIIDLFKWHEYNIIDIDLDKTVKEGIIFNPEYQILHPESYNREGKFSLEINSPGEKFKRAFLKIRAHIVYNNNYIKLYASNKRIHYIKGKDCEIKKTIFINITEALRKDKKAIINGILFTDKNTSIELYDARIEKISLYYEKNNIIS